MESEIEGQNNIIHTCKSNVPPFPSSPSSLLCPPFCPLSSTSLSAPLQPSPISLLHDPCSKSEAPSRHAALSPPSPSPPHSKQASKQRNIKSGQTKLKTEMLSQRLTPTPTHIYHYATLLAARCSILNTQGSVPPPVPRQPEPDLHKDKVH